MLNTERAIKIIDRHLVHGTKISDKYCIYKYERIYNSKPIALYYFDFSENILKHDLSISDYIHDIISTEYYNIDGSLRWNMYTVFVLDNNDIALKRQIEDNRDYSRKYVVDLKDLDALLSNPNEIQTDKNEILNESLAVKWSNTLTKRGLGDIASTKGIESIVSGYLYDNEKHMRTQKTYELVNDSISPIGELLSIDIDNYRQNRVKGKYKFGKVNLLYGPNTAGKTSFLEAIETCLCGTTTRSGKPDKSKIILNVSNGELKYPISTEVCRERDRAWFNNQYSTGNKLNDSFSRFNFFDTDAAYRIGSEKGADNIRQALETIILGGDTVRLCHRANQAYKEFKTNKNKLSIEIKTLTEKCGYMRNELAQYKKNAMKPNDIYETIKEAINQLKWLNKKSLYVKDNPSAVIYKLNNYIDVMDSAVLTLNWLDNITLNNIDLEINKYETILCNTDEKMEIIISISDKLTKIKEKEILLQNQLSILKMARPYYKEKNIEDLVKSQSQMAEQKQLLQNAKHALKMVSTIDLNRYKNIEIKLTELLLKNNAEANTHKKRIQLLKQEYNQVINRVKARAALKVKIKNAAKEYMQSVPDETICPLCLTKHAKGKLMQLANEETGDGKDTTALDKILSDISSEEKEYDNINKTISDVEILQCAVINICRNGTINNMTIKNIVERLNVLPKVIESANENITNINKVITYFYSKGLDYNSLIDVLNKMGKAFPEIKPNVINNSVIEDKIKKISSQLKKIEKGKNTLLLRNKKIHNDVRKMSIKIFGEEYDIHDYKENIKDISNKLTSEKKNIMLLCDKININKNTNISEKLKSMRLLIKKLERYKVFIDAEKKYITDGKKQENDLKKLENKINQVKMQHNKCEEAMKCLENIINEDTKKNEIISFESKYRDSINDIFSHIHNPREFSEISLIPQNAEGKLGDVRLKRNNNNEWAKINEVSTGQRTALAVSVFLALNRSAINAPKVILFDDPTPYTDELNILSFLDYIRDLVISQEKQIFYATANHKLASLFKHKFDFLLDKFVVHELVR